MAKAQGAATSTVPKLVIGKRLVPKILRRIDQEHGEHLNIPEQEYLIQGILLAECGHMNKGNANVYAAEQAHVFRKWLPKHLSSDFLEKPDIKGLFKLGPREVLTDECLRRCGFYVGATNGSEEAEEKGEGPSSEGRSRPSEDTIETETQKVKKAGNEPASSDVEPEQSALTSTARAVAPEAARPNPKPDSGTSPTEITAPEVVRSSQQPGSVGATSSALAVGSLVKLPVSPQTTPSDDRTSQEGKRKQEALPQSSTHKEKRQKLDGTAPSSASEKPILSKNEQRWIKKAGLPKTPALPPTQEPAGRSHIVHTADLNEISKLMGSTNDALFTAMDSYLEGHSVEGEAPLTFPVSPPPDLQALYRVLISNDRWQHWESSEQGAKGFRQDWTLYALFGACVLQKVFQTELPWDSSKDIPDKHRKYFEYVMKDTGYKPGTWYGFVGTKQIADSKFRDDFVVPLARDYAGHTIKLLQPHLTSLAKTAQRPGESARRDWVKHLEKAFKEAIVLKQTLQFSELGPFEYEWPRAGVAIDLERHASRGILTGANRVLYPVLPSILQRKRDREPVIFYRATVVQAATEERISNNTAVDGENCIGYQDSERAPINRE
ncbi:hypothetical protein M409DRAFT_53406 [Zasmidium cellare ATCC 36951]|uniref:Uncharacterized protein n=1 Tax=Zasmidium cellare ATCC 36951 TaxID=1080233 RepID=A0A6A6CLF4_ZASCE|nr:uncharacterized protein M409DRAFT_53406 [Zasmidium cellare ATCC 36951]KAF2168087.1 hypothetical protein M409DRAFT_53406 [Zasmidium cellare ATCC 36951]